MSNLLTSIGFDFSGCTSLTNTSLTYLTRLKLVKILCLDNCIHINDQGLKTLLPIIEQLEVLSLANCIHISDNGLEDLGKASVMLTIFNVSNCPDVTHNMLILFAKRNKRLATLHASSTYITDEGMTELCTNLSPKCLTSLDISFCRDISDYAMLALSQACPNLNHLNVCGLSKLTVGSMRSILSKCWYLKTLNCEDVFLLTDDVFRFDKLGDGRQTAEAAYMRQLNKVNLRDCVNITDAAIECIANRCRQTESLILRGCDKVTNNCFDFMTFVNPTEGAYAFTDALKVLDISFCGNINAAGVLQLLAKGTGIEELNVSGIVSITDEFVCEMCKLCPTIIRLYMSRCTFITDLALCHLADYLWLDALDISYCNKITDDSIEVLTSTCTGLLELNLRKLTRITSNSVTAIARNCNSIRQLDIKDCSKIADTCISDLYHHQKFVKIVR